MQDLLCSVVVPLSLIPLVGVLLWSEKRAARMGLVPDLDVSAPIYEGLPSEDPVLNANHAREGSSSPLSPLYRRDEGLVVPGSRPPASPSLSRRRLSRPMSGLSCTLHALNDELSLTMALSRI